MDDRSTPEKQENKDVTECAPASPSKAEDVRLPARLVSYVDEEQLSPSPDDMRRLSMETDTDDDGIIPPEPSGKCPRELQDLIAKYYYRVQNEGLDMNKLIQDKKNFRNPSIYEKLIQFCDINELDTNYPPEMYDPLRWGKESYYDELAKAQKLDMDRREKEKKEKLARIDFLTGTSKKTESEDEKKRKSKWDQAAPNMGGKPAIQQPGLLPLTSNVTGTKSTVISAFGSLPKKPRL